MFTFDGNGKLIIVDTGVVSFTAREIYSRWKEWVMVGDNSKFEIAFRSVAGDPISASQSISPYIFLNTVSGWRIRPDEADYELNIVGNLYSDDPDISMFAPTVGDFTVAITVDRSAASITTIVGGGSVDIQGALTAQGYTPARALKIDNLDVGISTRASMGQGLSQQQETMLLEMYRLMGLDPEKPLIVTPTNRRVCSGYEINQAIEKDAGAQSVTIRRIP